MEVSGRKIDISAGVPCDLCLLLGKNEKAEHFCADCNEFFCDKCCMVHKVTRYSRNHNLLDSRNMPKQKLESYEESVCSKHIGKGLEYFCEDHNTIFCSVCVILDHKNCNLLFIDEIAADFDKTPEYKSLTDSIASLTKQLQEMKEMSIRKGEDLKKSHGKFITDVKAFREEINQILDTIEDTIIKESDALKDDHLKLAVSASAMCNNLLAELNMASEKMREQLRYMQHRQLVMSAKETQIKVKEYQSKLVEMSQGKSMELEFVPNEKLLQSLRSFITMGDIKQQGDLPASTQVKPVEASEKEEDVEPVVKQEQEVPKEVTPPTPSKETTPADETFQKVEKKIQDAEEVEDELEEGEIVDDQDDYTMLKYKYAEGQWSPWNPEGKKNYDRRFLLQFQHESYAMLKPAGLPDIPDIILDEPNNVGRQYSQELSSSSTGSQDFDYNPKYVWNQRPDALYKRTKSILNKLTPQKFQTLVSQMQSLPINTEDKLKGVVDLVFEKAISEPNFSVTYANMCRCLSMLNVQSQTKPGEMVNFRAVLLTKCQREFEKDKSAEAALVAKRKEIDEAEDRAKKEELKQDLAYEESKAKRRSLGNIRFIGGLFRLRMLTENVMHDCVFKLLRTKDPENLECLCRLLTTIGKKLDTDKAKPRMDQYFTQMGKIVNEKKTSSRVRFMLQDVMDLRTNKWIPCRVDNNPKTISQIHREVEQEAQERNLLPHQFQASQQFQQKSNRGQRGPPGGRDQMGVGPNGWNTVGSRTPIKPVDRSTDPTKIKLSKQNIDESIQLGPGGGVSRFGAWGRGNTGRTTSRPSQENEKPNTPANRAVGSSQSMDPCRDAIRGRDINRRPEEQMPPPPPQEKTIPEEDMEKKTKTILYEYLHILDVKEAIECVKELPMGNHHHFVFNSINLVLERSNTARKQTGHLLHDLVKGGFVTTKAYTTGLSEALDFAEDMEIYIPEIWQYYGELISPMIQDGSVKLSFLREVCQPLVANNKAGLLIAEILNDTSHREGHKKVAILWQESGLKWSDYVPENQVDKFLIDKKLEYTKGDSAPSSRSTGLLIHDISTKLDELIVGQKSDNETVFDWIITNVDEPTTKTHPFIRVLMTAVCKCAIQGEKGKKKVDENVIRARHDLLQKYLDHQGDLELQALYALQSLVTKLEHPKGVLWKMFDTFYDEDIISEDAFIQWEKSEDEPEGKGAALKQVVQFFAWLREAGDEG